MDPGDVGPGRSRPIVVRVPVEPLEAVVEADAVDAVVRAGNVAVRGPLFGVAAQDAGDGPRWRVIVPVTAGCPQLARDSLNSRLWFRAKDEADGKAERRALLAAVARLEDERVDELVAAGVRYRIVRAEEYAGSGPGGIEQPRPTDPEPLVPNWDRAVQEAEVDEGLVLDPDAPLAPSQAVERLALRGLCYTGERFPEDVRADARRALDRHPDVLLLPPTFTVVERRASGWRPVSGPHASTQAARKTLDFSLTWMWPRLHGHIPEGADPHTDARTPAAAGTAGASLAAYAEAADTLRAGRVNRLEFQGAVYQIARTRRLLRWSSDGPEGPRPSDTNSQDPMRLHPRLDEDGRIHPEE